MPVSRYIIILDRYDDDDYVKDDATLSLREARTDQEGREQVARELQEAMDESGVPAGFFRVVARTVQDAPDSALNNSTPIEDSHAAAMWVLDQTRNY
jgi:hypothetical protein